LKSSYRPGTWTNIRTTKTARLAAANARKPGSRYSWSGFAPAPRRSASRRYHVKSAAASGMPRISSSLQRTMKTPAKSAAATAWKKASSRSRSSSYHPNDRRYRPATAASPICRYSAKRFAAMKKAPPVHTARSSESGGNLAWITANHPIRSLSGLLSASVRTSR
jgi:hypothetical protein